MNTRPSNSPPLPIPSLGGLVDWGRRELAGASSTPVLDAELLLAEAAGCSRSAILGFPEAEVGSEESGRYRDLVRERVAGTPIAYLTGRRDFYSLDLEVTPKALVPRPETELLVDLALDGLAPESTASVLDLGTGCGAIALALKHERPRIAVSAVDSSAEALQVARRNGARLALDVSWIESEWFCQLTGRRYDVILSNPPYVTTAELDASPELRHEPRAALDGGSDGLDAIRDIVAAAGRHLRPKGRLLVEHGFEQGPATARLAKAAGFTGVTTHQALGGRDRVLEARSGH